MATYFDTDVEEHRNLLPSDVRSHSELDNVIDQVENDIILFYTERSDSVFYVRLYGYLDADPDDVKSKFETAMRITIAAVAAFRLRNYNADLGLKSESLDGYSYTRHDSALSGSIPSRLWPKAWNSLLQMFDIRTRKWVH